jgi:predicted RND superfamily exporter protein
VETVEQLLSMKEDREIKRQEAEVKAAQMQEMLGTVKLLAPVIAKKMMGGNGASSGDATIPESASPMAAGVEQLRNSLMSDPDRMQSIFEKLTASEKAVLMELMSG